MRPDMNPVRVIKETKDENGITIYREWSNGYYQKSSTSIVVNHLFFIQSKLKGLSSFF